MLPLLLILLALVLFAFAAARWGVDSRDMSSADRVDRRDWFEY